MLNSFSRKMKFLSHLYSMAYLFFLGAISESWLLLSQLRDPATVICFKHGFYPTSLIGVVLNSRQEFASSLEYVLYLDLSWNLCHFQLLMAHDFPNFALHVKSKHSGLIFGCHCREQTQKLSCFCVGLKRSSFSFWKFSQTKNLYICLE